MVRGKVVVFDTPIHDLPGVQGLLRAGAAAVIAPANEQVTEHWDELAARPPGRTEVVASSRPRARRWAPPSSSSPRPCGAACAGGRPGPAQRSAGEQRERTTYNVIGVLHGAAPDADRYAVLLSAHYDHLGVRNGVIFHGANDDASGTAAVMEFARILGSAPARKRTVYFGLFGCEEEGGLGAQYFLSHRPHGHHRLHRQPGVRDDRRRRPASSPGFLMLTGWERSNLGPTLQAHGAQVGPDPYPEQHFFQRSDNYQLALQGRGRPDGQRLAGPADLPRGHRRPGPRGPGVHGR